MGEPKKEETLTCVACGKQGRPEEMFGTRTVNGETRWQAWCRDCRARMPEEKRKALPKFPGSAS